MIKSALVSVLRFSARTYVRRLPWTAGKMRVTDLFCRHMNWRPHRQTIKTRFGAFMDIKLPDAIGTAIYLTGGWEPCLTDYIQSRLRPGDTFVDVGANIGYYTLLASKLVGPSGTVIALEASPTIYERLARNIEMNRCSNVRALNVAASDAKGELSVFMAQSNNIGHTTTVASLAAKEGLKQETRVPCDSLENLVGTDALRQSRFIKIDVEGAELIVLAPLFDSLHRFSQRTEWLIEFSPEFSAGGQADLDRIFEAFMHAGYHAYRVPNEYSLRFQIMPPACTLERLTNPPTSLSDVLMSRNTG